MSVNVAITLAALVTGPLQAHALGPTGRGQVAEVVVPTSIAAVVGEFGLGIFAMRAVARGRSPGLLLGTIGAFFLAVSALFAVFSSFLATILVGTREPVHHLLTLGFILIPTGLFANLTGGMCAGLQRWGAFNLSRAIPPFGTVLAFTFLFLNRSLTVTSAVVVSFIVGALALLPLLWGLRDGGRVRFNAAIACEGLRFGSKAWVGSLLSNANAQVGQLLMIGILGPLQLGLFAVAANVANASDQLSTSVYSAIFPRVAAGEHDLVARASRVTILIVTCTSAFVALVAPFAVPIVFGARFRDSVPMIELLLVSVIGMAACRVYGAALTSVGRPGVVSGGDLLCLIVTVAALVLLLPLVGGIGAAIASVSTITALTAYLLFWCRRELSMPVREFLLIRRSDIRWMLRQVGRVLGRLSVDVSSGVLGSLTARTKALLQ